MMEEPMDDLKCTIKLAAAMFHEMHPKTNFYGISTERKDQWINLAIFARSAITKTAPTQ
jgi:hypothetical protein